jgi:hypothetical protein
VDAHAPKLLVKNTSSRTEDGVIWRLTMFGTTDFRIFSYSERHIGFLKPGNQTIPIAILPNEMSHGPDTRPVTDGDSRIGTLSVNCPDCDGAMLAVFFTWGHDGWYNDMPSRGDALLPKNVTPESIREYVETIQGFKPENRHAIQ